MFEFVVGVFILILVILSIELLALLLMTIKELVCDIYEEMRSSNGRN